MGSEMCIRDRTYQGLFKKTLFSEGLSGVGRFGIDFIGNKLKPLSQSSRADGRLFIVMKTSFIFPF